MPSLTNKTTVEYSAVHQPLKSQNPYAKRKSKSALIQPRALSRIEETLIRSLCNWIKSFKMMSYTLLIWIKYQLSQKNSMICIWSWMVKSSKCRLKLIDLMKIYPKVNKMKAAAAAAKKTPFYQAK